MGGVSMSSGRIKFIVQADEPALFFDSQVAAETSLESIDVENGVYPVAFDNAGVVFDVLPNGNCASLVRRADAEPDPERLKSLLQAFLTATNISFSAADTLGHLLEKCETYLEPPARWPQRKASGRKRVAKESR
jgi:hypothetical protein